MQLAHALIAIYVIHGSLKPQVPQGLKMLLWNLKPKIHTHKLSQRMSNFLGVKHYKLQDKKRYKLWRTASCEALQVEKHLATYCTISHEYFPPSPNHRSAGQKPIPHGFMPTNAESASKDDIWIIIGYMFYLAILPMVSSCSTVVENNFQTVVPRRCWFCTKPHITNPRWCIWSCINKAQPFIWLSWTIGIHQAAVVSNTPTHVRKVSLYLVSKLQNFICTALFEMLCDNLISPVDLIPKALNWVQKTVGPHQQWRLN